MDNGQEREPEPEKTAEEPQELQAQLKEEKADGELIAGYDPFCKVKELLERGDVTAAQARLDAFDERGGEWHYMQSVVYRKRNWLSECRKSLETAISFDPENVEYKKELESLDQMAESEKKHRKKRGKKLMGKGSGISEECMGGCIECCAVIGCEVICEGCCNSF